MSVSNTHVLTLDNINPRIKRMEYAVRGPIVARALRIQQEINQGVEKSFDEVIRCNIGDCHATGQQPLTFLRQVVALIVCPELLNCEDFPEDAKQRARRMLDACGGHSVGSYSQSMGVELVRCDVAEFIKLRDGIPTDFNNIFLSAGASDAVKIILHVISSQRPESQRAGMMIPIPQYPLYSATTDEFDICQIPYYLDENRNWGLSVDELHRALDSAREKCQPRAIVVINPGNPTGQVLSKSDIENVIKFAKENRLLILADEVYQYNVYSDDAQFCSFKSVLHNMGEEYSGEVELASFMSASKGFMGECGFRAGYCELVNWDDEVRAMLYKALSAKLCSSVIGQGLLDVIVNPPIPGEPSYDQFVSEKNKVLSDLKLKAKLATETFNSMPGIQCNEVQGAMYAFPRLYFPDKLIQEAADRGQKPDEFYCFSLLEEKGVCIVPGSGFGQKPGTYHFRMTILPTVEKLNKVMKLFREFHVDFIKRYS